MKCLKCKSTIKDFVQYNDNIFFYWCKCSVGSLIYRKDNNEEKQGKPVSRKRRKTSNIKGSGSNRKRKSKVQPSHRIKSKSPATAGRS